MSDPQETTPRQVLIDMAQGYFRGKVLCAAVRLGIADAIADGNDRLDDIARVTGSDPDSLYRLLRALASFGVFTEFEPGCFRLTPLGQPLRRDAPDSVWASVIFWPDLLADFWTYLDECVKAGASASTVMERQGVQSRWATTPDAQAIFHTVFAEPTVTDMAPIAEAYDFSGCGMVADLGGAGGALLSAILERNPQTRCLLVDRKEAIERAVPRLAAAGLASRCEAVAGDLLDAVPGGADVYIMKSVLHGYPDDNARRILTNCRDVMDAKSRLLIVEVVLPTQIDSANPKLEKLLMADLNMLAVTGGRERAKDEWESLLSSVGFELLRLVPLPVEGTNIIEVARRA